MSTKTVLRPLSDRVVIDRDEPETKTAGGLHLPQTNTSAKPIKGTVIAVGEGKTLEDGTVKPLSVKVGDRVLFGKQAVQEVEVDNATYVIVRQDDLMAVVDSE